MDELAKQMFEARQDARQLLDAADEALERAAAHDRWRLQAMADGTHPDCRPRDNPPPPPAPPPPASLSRADVAAIVSRKFESLSGWVAEEFEDAGAVVGEIRRATNARLEAAEKAAAELRTEIAELRLELLETRATLAELRLGRAESGDNAKVITMPNPLSRRGAA